MEERRYSLPIPAKLEWLRATTDWLTLTSPKPLEIAWHNSIYRRLVTNFPKGLTTEKDVHFGGWKGITRGPITHVSKEWGSMLVLKGEYAHIALESDDAFRGHCSRLDLAVTFRLPSPNPSLAMEIAEAKRDGVKMGKRLYYPIHVLNMEGGSTVYIGQRSASRLLRVYDRGAKTGEYQQGMVWRIEFQYSGQLAERMVYSMPNTASDLSSYILSCVVADLQKFGIIMPIDGPLQSWDIMELTAVNQSPDRTLVWLRTSVKPALSKLIDKGLEKEALEALGIASQDSFWDEVF